MRRILLAAFALLLLGAAPASATECRNLASATNGGTAVASSEYPGWPATALNDGRRQTSSDAYWNDFTRNVWPDSAAIEWGSATTIDQIVLRSVVFAPNWAAGSRTLGRVRVQYWDATTSAWVDVAGRAGQDNPIVDWVGPTEPEGGDEIKQFDFTPVTTTRIRALIETGTSDGWSFLEEIEAYERSACDVPPTECVDVATDGAASASSVHSSGLYPVTGVNNGQRESGATKGYWNDNTNGTWPDWVQVEWRTAQTLERIVARIPIAQTGFPTGEVTLRRTRVQYWDAATSAWVDVVGGTGQPNPIVDWTGPIGSADGTETKTFDLATPVTTTKVRALVEDGSTDGWSWLDELEAYTTDCIPGDETPTDVNLALVANGGRAIASSVYTSAWAAPAALNDGRRQDDTDYWMDGTTFDWPDWAGIAWSGPKLLNRIVVRGPALPSSYPTLRRTLERTRVQYWDDSSSTWRDAAASGNPVLNWVMPADVTDGSEIKQFDFSPVVTRRIRVLIEAGGDDGWSWLEEVEAYRIS